MGARGEISAVREVLDQTSLIKKEQLEITTNTDIVFGLPPKTGMKRVDHCILQVINSKTSITIPTVYLRGKA